MIDKGEYDIFYFYADGRKACVSWPKFKSALDASKSLAMLASWGLPPDVVRATAEDAKGNWICEITRRPMG
jgi:hypothetical protein